jgi:hypothetical protein
MNGNDMTRVCEAGFDFRLPLVGAVLGSLVMTTTCCAESTASGPPAMPPSVPTFEKLQHTLLPASTTVLAIGLPSAV